MAVGEIPPARVLAGTVPLITGTRATSTIAPALAASATPTTSIAAASHVGIITPSTPLAHLVPPAEQPSTSADAIVVSRNLPPIPNKLAEKIWRKEFVEMDQLLPSRLGAPEPTLGDLVVGEKKQKEKKSISSIQEWIVCFNAYAAVILQREPERSKDLLAYSSLIVKASWDFEGEAWLNYDKFFRRQAAAEPTRYSCWGEIEPSIWTQHFGRAIARPTCRDCGSKNHSSCGKEDYMRQRKADYHSRPYPIKKTPPVCLRWNRGEFCSTSICRYQHICSECSKDHRVRNCPQLHRSSKTKGDDCGITILVTHVVTCTVYN